MKTFTERGLLLAENLAYNSKYGVVAEDRLTLESLIKGVFRIEDVIYVGISDSGGKILVEKIKETSPEISRDDPYLFQLQNRTLTSDKSQVESFFSKDGKILYGFSAPVTSIPLTGKDPDSPSNLIKHGSVHVGMSPYLINQQISRRIFIIGIVVLIMMAGGMSLTYFLSRFYIRPLETLALIAQRVAGGDLSQIAPVCGSRDEIGDLTTTFNQMIRSLSLRDQQIKEQTNQLKILNLELTDLNLSLEERVATRTLELKNALNQVHNEKKEANRLKSEFVSHMSHEIRTPLTSIKGYIDNLQDGIAGELNERQKDYLERMNKNTNRLTSLINDLLDISRIESGKMKIDLASLCLPKLIEDVIRGLRPIAAEKDLKITLNPFDGKGEIQGDREKLEQVITNLLDNAIKFTPHGGHITIILGQDHRFIKTSIRDTGIGIPKEDRLRIFERFYRNEHESPTQTKRTGLGLFIVKTLIKMHGGEIWIESEAGRGSEFSFTLPLHSNTAQSQS